MRETVGMFRRLFDDNDGEQADSPEQDRRSAVTSTMTPNMTPHETYAIFVVCVLASAPTTAGVWQSALATKSKLQVILRAPSDNEGMRYWRKLE